jgi:hypothetical protein
MQCLIMLLPKTLRSLLQLERSIFGARAK